MKIGRDLYDKSNQKTETICIMISAMNKPRIFLRLGKWFCRGTHGVGVGLTPSQAFWSYVNLLAIKPREPNL